MDAGKVIRVPMMDKRVEQPERGWLAQLYPLLAGHLQTVCDIHLVTLKPGVVRGNHFHKNADEAFLLLTGAAQLAWVEGERRTDLAIPAADELFFFGRGVPHAVYNHTPETIIGIAFSNRIFDESNPDRYPFSLISPSGLIN